MELDAQRVWGISTLTDTQNSVAHSPEYADIILKLLWGESLHQKITNVHSSLKYSSVFSFLSSQVTFSAPGKEDFTSHLRDCQIQGSKMLRRGSPKAGWTNQRKRCHPLEKHKIFWLPQEDLCGKAGKTDIGVMKDVVLHGNWMMSRFPQEDLRDEKNFFSAKCFIICQSLL